MEKVLHIILSFCITILFVLTINIAKITGDLVIDNITILIMGIIFFIVLFGINLLFIIRKK